MHAGGENG
ncbi:unnamed protein product, partial [Allacma fusca]